MYISQSGFSSGYSLASVPGVKPSCQCHFFECIPPCAFMSFLHDSSMDQSYSESQPPSEEAFHSVSIVFLLFVCYFSVFPKIR